MKIKIGGLDYEVIEEHNLCAEDGTKRLNGHIVYDQCQIKVDSTLDRQVKNQTIWHEILHGILTHAGIEEQSETHIDVIAYGIVQVLRDNSELRYNGDSNIQ